MSTETAQAVLEVDLAAVVANWRSLCAAHPSGAVAGVVKADAYGLGAVAVVRALYAAGCRHFFVAYLNEAAPLRPVAPEAMIAVLSGPIAGTEGAYVADRLTPVLGSLQEIARWQGLGPAILHVDTGMARLGIAPTELASVPTDLDLLYVMTHLVAAEEPDDPANERQRLRFAAARAVLPAAASSFANSSGIFLGPPFASNLARPGAALYGINPTPGRANPMRPVVRLLARVLAVRDVPAGTGVGYNGTWVAARDSRIATAAAGYADGYHRTLSNTATACFDGAPVPLVGRVSMDLTTFDVTDHPGVRPGSWLELIGPSQPPDALAVTAGTNGYEILTSLGRRFSRMYLPA
jgi:alanine racemase